MTLDLNQCVSIPFKRESGSKAVRAKIAANKEVFQFPSNGKADPKRPHFNPSGAVAPYA